MGDKFEDDRIQGARSFHFNGKNRSIKIKPKKRKECKDKYVKFRYADNFIKNMVLPKEDESIYAIVSGSFIFGDILYPISERIKDEKSKTILNICTLSLGEENIDMISEMFEDNIIDELNIIVSNYFFAHERGKDGLFNYLIESVPINKCKISIADVHTKIVMFKNDKYNLVLSGSANLRSSKNVEQFEIRDSEELYFFQKTWMDSIHNEYNVIGKPRRSLAMCGIFNEWDKKKVIQPNRKK